MEGCKTTYAPSKTMMHPLKFYGWLPRVYDHVYKACFVLGRWVINLLAIMGKWNHSDVLAGVRTCICTCTCVNMADIYIISSRKIDFSATKMILLLPSHVGFLKIFSIIMGFSDIIL